MTVVQIGGELPRETFCILHKRKSVRNTILDRDHLQDWEIDALFDDFEYEVSEGYEPEDAMYAIFDLGPEYLDDAEIQSILREVL